MAAQNSTNKFYIEGIRRGDSKVIRVIYKDFGGAIWNLIKKRGGNQEDASDVFQEALVVIFKKTKDIDFQLNSSFFTYFYAICRNIWSGRQRKKSNQELTFDNQTLLIVGDTPHLDTERNEQYYLYRKKFSELGKNCQKILTLYIQRTSMAEIMRLMGFKNINQTKARKFLCKKKLVQLVKEDPSFKELTS